MPAPQASMMQQIARMKFTSFAIKVPKDWKQPQGDPKGKQYTDAFKPSERAVPPGAPPLFLPASPNKYHVDTQKMHIDKIGKFIDGICSAICSAWSQWQTAATLVGVIVNGPTAAMGQVVGPPMGPLIMASAPKETPMLLKYSTAVANAMNTAWLSYTATIKVPGMPWYPAFTAFPSPVAPPTPNIPCPVIALTQVDATLQTMTLKSSMVGLLGDPTAPFHDKLFEAIAEGVNKCLLTWKSSTMVTNVLGTGPIPTFAPPYVPAGPVVGGVGNMTPGGFA